MTDLIARDHEMALCRRARARPGSVGVLLVGPAGVGKSFLASKFVDELGGAGVRVVGSEAAADYPFAAVAPLLVPLEIESSTFDILRHTVSTLVAGAVGPHLIVLVDDAQHLDEMSAMLLHQLTQTGRAFLVATARAGEALPESISSLWADGHLDRIDLQPFDEEGAASFVQSLVPGWCCVERITLRRLFEASQGNPLFLRQLVIASLDDQHLVPDESCALALPGPLVLPVDLVAAIAARLAKLDDDHRSILEALALCQGALGAAILARTAGPSGDRHLADLERSGFVVGEYDGRRLDVRLAHPMYGEALREMMPVTSANDYRRRLAAAVTATGAQRRGDSLQVALWLLHSGSSIKRDIAVRAVTEALMRGDPAVAAQIVDGAEWGVRAEDHPLAQMLLAEIWHRAGQPLKVVQHLDRLDAVLAPEPPADVAACDVYEPAPSLVSLRQLRVDAQLLRFDALGLGLGRLDEALALELDGDVDTAARAALTTRKAVLAAFAGRLTLADSLLSTVPDVRRGSQARLWLLAGRSLVASRLGRTAEALHFIDETDAAVDETPWRPTMPDHAAVLMERVRALYVRGDVQLALDRIDQISGDEAALWPEHFVAMVRTSQSSMLRMHGDITDAIEVSTAAAAVHERTGAGVWVDTAYAHVAASLAALGDSTAAAAAAERCVGHGFDSYHHDLAHAWATIASGRVVAGRQMLRACLDIQRGCDALEELNLLLDLLGIGPAIDLIEHATELADRGDSEPARLVRDWALASHAQNGVAVAEAGERLDALGFCLAAAHARFDAAAIHLRRNEVRSYDALLDRYGRALGAAPEWCSPGLQPPRVQARLSVREREVAALAATGLRRQAVGDALGIGKRTVEGYLQSVYAKLNLERWTDLADAFTRADASR